MDSVVYWNSEGESVLTNRDAKWGGAIAYYFTGRPIENQSAYTVAVDDFGTHIDRLREEGFFPVRTWDNSEGTWYAAVPDNAGPNAREIAAEAITYELEKRTNGVAIKIDVVLCPEGAGVTVFREYTSEDKLSDKWLLSEAEIDELQSGSYFPDGVPQAYARAFETIDFDADDVQDRYVGELDFGQSLTDWYERSVLPDREMRLIKTILGGPLSVEITAEEIEYLLQDVHMRMSVDSTSLEQEYKDQDGFVFRIR